MTKILTSPGMKQSIIGALSQQGVIEGLEEGASYVLNSMLDYATANPNAQFSIIDLLKQIGMATLSGFFMGGAGAVIGNISRSPATAPQAAQEGVLPQASS
jgi:hypothetical protein